MENLFSIVGQLAALFAIVAVGYLAKKTKYMTTEFDALFSRLILNVAIPGLVIGSVLTADKLPSREDILMAFFISCASYVLMFIIAYLVVFLLRIPHGSRGVYRFMLCFGNVGFIGFPVLSTIFGQSALVYATIFNLPFNLLVFTVGAWFLTRDTCSKSDPPVNWRTFVTPAIISCIVAIVLALLNVHSVPLVGDAFALLGSLTTPGALLVIGSSLANVPVRRLAGTPRLWAMAVIRVALIPLAVWGVFHFFITDPLMLGAIMVISGMPVASNGTMLCFQYGGDSFTMAQGTFITTVLSLVSIPLLVAFYYLVV